MELVNGEKMELDKVRRDGYGAIRITIMDSNDKEVEILSEELA